METDRIPTTDTSSAPSLTESDRQSPAIGYLPGTLPWFQCEKLAAQGMRVVNSGTNGETHVDRRLFSGDSPKACDQLGKMIAEALLKDFAG